jgi:hypothetical protein
MMPPQMRNLRNMRILIACSRAYVSNFRGPRFSPLRTLEGQKVAHFAQVAHCRQMRRVDSKPCEPRSMTGSLLAATARRSMDRLRGCECLAHHTGSSLAKRDQILAQAIDTANFACLLTVPIADVSINSEAFGLGHHRCVAGPAGIRTEILKGSLEILRDPSRHDRLGYFESSLSAPPTLRASRASMAARRAEASSAIASTSRWVSGSALSAARNLRSRSGSSSSFAGSYSRALPQARSKTLSAAINATRSSSLSIRAIILRAAAGVASRQIRCASRY